MKKLYGTYLNSKEAGKGVEELLKLDYKIDQIHALTKEEFKNLDLSKYKEKNILENYRKNLKDNQIVILVDIKESNNIETPNWDDREDEFYEDLDNKD